MNVEPVEINEKRKKKTNKLHYVKVDVNVCESCKLETEKGMKSRGERIALYRRG